MKLSAALVRELRTIYGTREAARRIDHMIGYENPKVLALPAPERAEAVPRSEAHRYFETLRAELERAGESDKQRLLNFKENVG